MEYESPSPSAGTQRFLPIAAAVVAIAIFIFDSMTPVEVSAGVLYVAVVQMAVRICRPRVVLIVALGCVALTVLSHFLSRGDPWGSTALVNRFIGVLAIGAITLLALKNQSVQLALRRAEQTLMVVAAAKEAEDRVRQTERNLHITIEAIPAFVVSTLPDGSVDFVSQNLLDYLGLSREEWLGSSWMNLTHPEDLDRVVNKRRVALAGGEPLELELRFRQADGKYRWFLGRTVPLRDEKGNIVKWYATVHDIEDRKQAEEKLRRSETCLAEAQRLSQTGSFVWIPSSGEIYWSDETYRIFEIDRTTIPTVDVVRQRIHPEDVVYFEQIVERATHDWQDYAHEYRLRMPDGRVKHLQIVARALRSETNDVRYIGAVMDVTEQKWAQAERERLEQRLRRAEKMEAVGRLAGGIAHDFNNVLAGVVAYGEMVLDEAPEDSPLKRYARNVLTAASRGRELVEQILTYSRSQRGKLAPVDLSYVVAETLELLRGSLPAGIRLEASAPEAPLVVISDATQLHQVVMNLCSNAIQAMSAGGTIRVILATAEFSREHALSHGTLAPGHYVRLIVEDSGSGMDEATLARIFEPFFTTKEVGQGTGLGLSLVHGIIIDSDGAIGVQSAPHQGTTFTIYLPHSEITLAAAEGAASAPPRGHGERVLLIDDEALVLAVTAEMLSRLGYEAVSFSNSDAALAAFEAAPERFDVVVTDEVMPGLTGTRLARKIRGRRLDLPIVLVSGYSGANLTQDALAAGVSELLTKPLQSREMAAALARVLHRTA
jgi:PAS domain S-box-containing protein